MADAIKRILSAGDSVAMHAVIVDAKNEAAKAFYERLGFHAFSEPSHTAVSSTGFGTAYEPSALNPCQGAAEPIRLLPDRDPPPAHRLALRKPPARDCPGRDRKRRRRWGAMR